MLVIVSIFFPTQYSHFTSHTSFQYKLYSRPILQCCTVLQRESIISFLCHFTFSDSPTPSSSSSSSCLLWSEFSFSHNTHTLRKNHICDKFYTVTEKEYPLIFVSFNPFSPLHCLLLLFLLFCVSYH